MTTPEAATLICKTLRWAARNATLPAIRHVEMNGEAEVNFTDTFTGQRFRMLVEEVEPQA